MEKATKSSLTFKQVDYDTGFRDSQRLEAVCSNLAQTSVILQSTMDIANAIRKQYEDLGLQSLYKVEDDRDILQGLAYDIQRIEGFQRTTQGLSKQAEHASQLVRARTPARKAHLTNLSDYIDSQTSLFQEGRYSNCTLRSIERSGCSLECTK
jgi:hypothetical protein